MQTLIPSTDQLISAYMQAGHHADVSIDPNANIKRSPANLAVEYGKENVKHWLLNELQHQGNFFFGNKFTLAPLQSGRLYLHNSTKPAPYCVGASAADIMWRGKQYGHLYSKPPTRLFSFMGQAETFVLNLAQQFAGATALSDLPIIMAYYAATDFKVTDKDIENAFQSFVHVVNDTTRVGGESPFTNISVNSPTVVEDIFDNYTFPDGTRMHDLLDQVDRVQGIIMQFMARGDPCSQGLQYRFPILTINLTPEDVSTDWATYVFHLNKRGYFNINTARRFSSCCRLQSDISEMLQYKVSTYGSGGIKVGSHRVVTVNLPGIALEANGDETRFLDILPHYLEDAAMILYAHKHICQHMVDGGMLTFFKPLGMFNLNMFFSTIGLIGFPDALSIMGSPITDPSGQSLGDKIMDLIMEKAREFTAQWGYEKLPVYFNVEEVPAETAAGTLAKLDGSPKWYSNQFVPLDLSLPLADRAMIEGRYASKLTGGSMAFFSLSSELDEEQSLKFHRWVAGTEGISQFTLNYGWSLCPDHLTQGYTETCPKCGKPTQFFERVVGYMTSLEDMQSYKQQEVLHRYKASINDT